MMIDRTSDKSCSPSTLKRDLEIQCQRKCWARGFRENGFRLGS